MLPECEFCFRELTPVPKLVRRVSPSSGLKKAGSAQGILKMISSQVQRSVKHTSVSRILFFILFFFVSASTALALPRYALYRGEASCLGCHLDPMGGQLRTESGDGFGINRLPMWKRGEKFSANLSESIRIGADFRSQYLAFSDRLQSSVRDLQDSLNKTNIAVNKKTSASSLQMMAMPVYFGAALTQTLYGYLSYDFLNKAFDGFALAHIVHASGEILSNGSVVSDAYLKTGAFLPAYGIRFDDHTIYARGGNEALSGADHAGFFWKPNYHDIGAEAGVTLFDRATITLGYFNGNENTPNANFNFDTTNRMAMVGRVIIANEFVEDMFSGEIGASFYNHRHVYRLNTGADSTFTVSLFAVHGGVRVGPVTVLAELDMGKNAPTGYGSFNAKATALAIEGVVKVVQGLDGLLRYESYSDHDIADNLGMEVKSRITIGAQWFPLRFIEFRPEFRIASTTNPNQDPLQPREQHTLTTALFQTHIFF
jgi:hypothetical protein